MTGQHLASVSNVLYSPASGAHDAVNKDGSKNRLLKEMRTLVLLCGRVSEVSAWSCSISSIITETHWKDKIQIPAEGELISSRHLER